MSNEAQAGSVPGRNLTEMAELMREERGRAVREQTGPVRTLNLLWGGVYLIGFLLLWAGLPGGGHWVTIPAGIAVGGAAAVLLAGIVSSVVLSVRMGSGLRGESARAGAMYGWSWAIGMSGTWLYGQALALGSGIPVGAYYPSAFLFTAGLCYLVGAAVWGSRWQFAQGIVLIAVAIAAAAVGGAGAYLVLAFAGGGSLIAFAVVLGALFRADARSAHV